MRDSKRPAVYILASARNGTLYIGVTSDLMRRVGQHKESVVDGFTKDHGVRHLVYFERHGTMVAALEREKQLKRWRRAWKIQLIEQFNPQWDDLADSLV